MSFFGNLFGAQYEKKALGQVEGTIEAQKAAQAAQAQKAADTAAQAQKDAAKAAQASTDSNAPGTPKKSTSDWIFYGVGGLVLLIIIVSIIVATRPKKK